MADLICTIMVLIKGRLDDVQPFWAYMCIKPSDAHRFHEARSRGALNLEEYGTVVEWGHGDHPPQDVIAQMQRQYGMREDFEQKLLDAMENIG